MCVLRAFVVVFAVIGENNKHVLNVNKGNGVKM